MSTSVTGHQVTTSGIGRISTAATSLTTSTISTMTTTTATTTSTTTTTNTTSLASASAVSAPSVVQATVSRVSTTSSLSEIDAHLSQLDPQRIHAIPRPSSIPSNQQFSIQHLQRNGLDNDDNICSIISLIKIMHRMQIVNVIHNPLSLQSNQDYIDSIFVRVLRALPSRSSFSLQLLKQVWNQHQSNGYMIQQNDDVWSCADAILSSLR